VIDEWQGKLSNFFKRRNMLGPFGPETQENQCDFQVMVPQAGPLIFNEISGLTGFWLFWVFTRTLRFLRKCPAMTLLQAADQR